MKKQTQSGFTIVELLIVIVVIGILAAITVVAFNGVQNRAKIATISTDLAGAAKTLAVHEVDAGTYPATLAEANNNQGVKASTGTTYQYSASGSTYCLTATNGTLSYKISHDATAPAPGGCAGHGVGGVAPITNLALNPSIETNANNINNQGTVGGTISSSTEQAKFGSASLKTVGAGGRKWMTSETFATGETVRWSVWLYPVGSAVTFTSYWEASGTGGGGSSSITAPANAWTQFSGSVTFSSTQSAKTGYGFGYLRSGSVSGDGVVVYADGAMITRGNTAYTYADGTSTNWVWNGTPHAASSTGPPL